MENVYCKFTFFLLSIFVLFECVYLGFFVLKQIDVSWKKQPYYIE